MRSVAQVTGALREAGFELERDARVGSGKNTVRLLVSRAPRDHAKPTL